MKPRPRRSVDELVALVAPVHGERRARKAGLMTRLAAARMFYEARIAMRDRAFETMRRAYELFQESTEAEAYWRGVIDGLLTELDAMSREKQLEHRRMFKRTTMVHVDPETGEVTETVMTTRKGDSDAEF